MLSQQLYIIHNIMFV